MTPRFACARLLAAFAAASALLPAACMEPPDVGDPYPLPYWVLDKALFDPAAEWWVQRTVTQAPYEAGFTYVGDSDLTDRVHFRIEEHWLIAYRSQDVYYADDPDVVTAPDTAPVLIYPVLRHVDIINGQQIEAPNKPWYDRTHVIVDWGAEQSGSFRFTLGIVETTGVSFWNQDLTDAAESPIFSPDYVDFTTHAVVSPSEQYDPETETPAFCSPEGVGAKLFVDAVNCAPMEIAYRTALRRIPAGNDYERLTAVDPSLPPGWFDRFFRVARVHLDEQYGSTLPGRMRVASRFNVWQRSLDDAGARLPLAAREVRPIAFHLNAEFPADLVETARTAVTLWDDVFRSAIKQARAAECTDAGGDEATCQAEAIEPEHVVVFCEHAPVQEGDPAACGEAGTLARLGDLRTNMLYWVTQPNVNHPIGMAWWSPDIATGETVAGHAKVYAESIDRSAAFARDAVMLATGQLTATDIATGRYLDSYAATLQAFSADPFGAAPPQTLPVGGLPATAPPLPAGDLPTGNGPVVDGALPAFTSPALGMFRDQAFSPIVGTELEALALDDDALIMAGLSPDMTPDASLLAAASPLRSSLVQRSQAHSELAQMVANAGGDLVLPADLDLGSLIDAVGSATPEEIYREARRRFAFTVLAHEIGHVFALKHNFAGSYDALNYQPGYWANRDTSCIGGRYRCPLTAAEQSAHLEDFAYSSIMDYHPAVSGFTQGLGPYDRAAIHALYGGVAEVFADAALKDNPDARAILAASYSRDQVAHVPLVLKPDGADPRGYRVSSYHYSRYPQIFGALGDRVFVSARSLTDGLGVGGANSDAQGRLLVPYLSCSDVEKGNMPYCLSYDHGADPFEIVTAQTNWFRTYYPFNNFRRERLVFEPYDYIASMWFRVFLPVKRWNDWLVHTHVDYDEHDAAAYTDPDFLEPMQKAGEAGFQFLAALLATPEPGVYFDEEQPDGSRMLEPFRQPISHDEPVPTTGSVMSIDFPEGRIYESRAAYDAGLILMNVGSAVDKELALEALLDPSFFAFPGRETWDQSELWMLNFYNTNPDALLDVIGSLVAGDWTRLGARYADAATSVVHRDYRDLTSSEAGDVVDPAVGFNLRLRALIYGVGLIYTGYADRSFLESVRIVVTGSGEEPTTAATPVDFTDPTTSKPYRAWSRQVGGVELGVGARVLTQAQALATVIADPGSTPEQVAAAEHALRRQVELIEVMRSVVRKYDEAGFTGVSPESLRP